MHEVTKAVIQQYNNHLLEKFNEISKNYDDLKAKAENIYNSNLENDEYKYKLKFHVNDIPVNSEYKEDFSKYEFTKKAAIKNQLLRRNFDDSKVNKIFQVRLNGLKRSQEKIDVENIGTMLNLINNFHHNIFIDIKRNNYSLAKKVDKSTNELYHMIELDDFEFQTTEVDKESIQVLGDEINYKFSN